MIVVDASALVELLTDEQATAEGVRTALDEDHRWVAPEHVLTEVANAVRGLWLGGRSSREELKERLAVLPELGVEHFPVAPLLTRIGALAPNATAYDAAYLALAEALDAPLVTVDRKLADVPGVQADIRVIVP